MATRRYVHWSIRGLDAFQDLVHDFHYEGDITRRDRLMFRIMPFFGERYPQFLYKSPLKNAIIIHRIMQEFTRDRGWLGHDYMDQEFGIHHETLINYSPDEIGNNLKVHFYPTDSRTRTRWMMKDRLRGDYLKDFRDRNVFYRKLEEREIKAQQVMKKLFGKKLFIDYVRGKAIPVIAASGRTYMMNRHSTHYTVIENGKPVESICVALQSRDYCSTDDFLMRVLSLWDNETDFNAVANHFAAPVDYARNAFGGFVAEEFNPRPDPFLTMPLTEVYRHIRKGPRMAMFEPLAPDATILPDHEELIEVMTEDQMTVLINQRFAAQNPYNV
jgi:hypothetical protein